MRLLKSCVKEFVIEVLEIKLCPASFKPLQLEFVVSWQLWGGTVVGNCRTLGCPGSPGQGEEGHIAKLGCLFYSETCPMSFQAEWF